MNTKNFKALLIITFLKKKTPRILKNIIRKIYYKLSIIKSPLHNIILRHVFQKKLPKYLTHKAENTTYLFYYHHVRAGINHLKANLKIYLLEAGELNRTCVLTNPDFAEQHNNGIKVNESWAKYIEFEKSTFPKQIDYIFYNDFLKKQFSKKEILIVSGNYKIKPKKNKKYRVIIRNIGYTPSLFSRFEFTEELPIFKLARKLPILFYPAKRIIDEAKIVLEQIPKNFCAVHMRRGDMLKNFNFANNLSPQNVIRKLQEYNPQKLPVYLMTNEPNKNYYNNLNNKFKVYHYYNFNNLIQVAEEKDNYLLYEIEQFIFSKAKIKIETFKHSKFSFSDIKRW